MTSSHQALEAPEHKFPSLEVAGMGEQTQIPSLGWRHLRHLYFSDSQSQRFPMHPGIISASLFSYAQNHSLIHLTTNPGVRLCLGQIPSKDNT